MRAEECRAPAPERRAEPAPALARIEVEVSLTSESQFFAGLSGDVSTGGVFVQTYRVRPVDSPVLVTLSLPTGQIQTTGVVCWVRAAAEGAAPGLGVAFDELPSRDRELVDEFCKTRPALYHEVESD